MGLFRLPQVVAFIVKDKNALVRANQDLSIILIGREKYLRILAHPRLPHQIDERAPSEWLTPEYAGACR